MSVFLLLTGFVADAFFLLIGFVADAFLFAYRFCS